MFTFEVARFLARLPMRSWPLDQKDQKQTNKDDDHLRAHGVKYTPTPDCVKCEVSHL